MALLIIKLLQFGTAGLFVALPFLAYKVIIAMITVKNLDPAVVRVFYWFLGFELLLALMFVALRIIAEAW